MSSIAAFGFATVAFPPDPVCAAMAMGLMRSDWAVASGTLNTIIRGNEPSFWVKEMSSLLDGQLFMPTSGDYGEVYAALYMLLCADQIRHGQDRHMRKFEIDVNSGMEKLSVSSRHEKKFEEPQSKKSKHGNAIGKQKSKRGQNIIAQIAVTNATTFGIQQSCMMNFIQVCRNCFRTHAWLKQTTLEFMYDTAVGVYTFMNCPAIDIVFPIQQLEPKKFHTALVSIKCWDAINHAEMKDAHDAMKDYVKGYREDEDADKKALCILFVIGAQKVGTVPASEGNFPSEDAFVTIVVP